MATVGWPRESFRHLLTAEEINSLEPYINSQEYQSEANNDNSAYLPDLILEYEKAPQTTLHSIICKHSEKQKTLINTHVMQPPVCINFKTGY